MLLLSSKFAIGYSALAKEEKNKTKIVRQIFIIKFNIKLYCNYIANSFQKIKVGLGFGAGEGIRILDPLNLCLMGLQKLEILIAT